MNNDLISRKTAKEEIRTWAVRIHDPANLSTEDTMTVLDSLPTVDAVEVDTIRAWLYAIAMNNTNNYLGDACEEIISRLDGLKVFARERRNE